MKTSQQCLNSGSQSSPSKIEIQLHDVKILVPTINRLQMSSISVFNNLSAFFLYLFKVPTKLIGHNLQTFKSKLFLLTYTLACTLFIRVLRIQTLYFTKYEEPTY